MNKHPFSTDPNYLQHVRGMCRLHALVSIDQDEGLEADEIRDRLDLTWYILSETEQARIRGLSADLYSISDPPKEPLPTNPQVQRKLIEVGEAREAGNWDLALSLLRESSRHLDPALLSEFRGEIWQAAGDEDTAKLFFDHAASLVPSLSEKA